LHFFVLLPKWVLERLEHQKQKGKNCLVFSLPPHLNNWFRLQDTTYPLYQLNPEGSRGILSLIFSLPLFLATVEAVSALQ